MAASRLAAGPSGQWLLMAPSHRAQGQYHAAAERRRRQRRQRQVWRAPTDARLHMNTPRLTHYIEEANTGRGFIKEVSFGADGRVICSPFGFGYRILAFDDHLNDLSHCAPDPGEAPRRLVEVGTVGACHQQVVLSTSFAPNAFSLVTGCLKGRIVWHDPRP